MSGNLACEVNAVGDEHTLAQGGAQDVIDGMSLRNEEDDKVRTAGHHLSKG